MGKLVAFRNHTRFENELNNNNINEYALNFIIDTGQLYTHGIYLNAVTFGADNNGSVDLTVANLTKSISLASHTHSNYLEKNSNIDIGSYKIVSGNNLLLSYDNSRLYLGDTDVPTYIKGSAYRDTYTILDTGNFSIENKTLSGSVLSNVLLFTYGSNKVLLDYVKRINTSSTFDSLASYTCLGTTSVDLKRYGFITFYSSEGTFNSPWALLRININDKSLEYRTSASTNWSSIATPDVPLNALNTAGIVDAPDYNSQNKVWKTDNLGNPAWRDETTYLFLPLTFQLNGTDLMTYDTLSAKTIIAGTNISFSFLEDVLTINANSTIYNVVTKQAAGLCPVLPDEEDDSKFLRQDGTWALPTYTSDTDTWRPIKVNNTQLLGSLITSGDLEFINGTNTTVEWTQDNKLKINAVDTWDANAVGVAGYVAAPTKEANVNMTWQTDANGVPAWRASNNHTHSYLPLTGGDVSNNINLKGSFDLTKSNNNIESTIWPTTFNILDAGNRISARLENVVLSDGTNGFFLYARLYNSSGTITALRGLSYNLTKADTPVGTWTVHDPASFRTALGLGARATDSTEYLPLVGGTLTGGINIKYDTDTSRVYGLSMLNISGSVTASLCFHNTANRWLINAIGASDIWSDSVGKYTFIVGNNELKYNTYPILHSNNYSSYAVKRGGDTINTSGANLVWGNITLYGGGSNGGINSMLVGDDVTIGDCNLGGIMGMKSTGTNAGFKFFNSSGTSIGGILSTNGTLQWQNASGTFYNIYHSGNLPAYLPLAGGVMSGNISFGDSTSTYPIIKFKSSSDPYGQGIYIGGGGMTVIGGGESSDVMAAQYAGGTEVMAIGNDGNIEFYSNLQDGWNSRKGMTFSTDGNLYIGGNKTWHAGNFNPGDYLARSGGTMNGNISFSNSGTGFRGINYGTMGDNDQWRIGGAATASNAGYMEIATADDGNEPIYVRLYTGVFTTLKRTLTLLDANGNTSLPGTTTSSGTITASGGYLVSTLNGNTVTIGSANNSYMHFLNSANIPFWFNKDIRVLGELYAGSGYNQKVWHAGNLNPNNYHPLNGKITVGGGGYSWYNIQQYNSSDANPSYYNASCAIININSYGGWQPWIRCVDSEKGSWALGQYTNFVTLIRFVKTNTGNGLGNYSWTFNSDGSLSASKFVGTLQGNCSGTASGLVDGSSKMTSAYNKAGLDYSAYTWLAGWNGYELRAVNKSLFALASHTHNINDIKWPLSHNLTASATANNQEWSIDLNPGSYTGCYWHVWSSKLGASILSCYPDDSKVVIRLDCYARNYYTTSDRNKKHNISSFSEHIRKFQFKNTEKWHYGVIALEVPEMFRDGEEGNMTVNYNSVLSYYVGLLENRVKELENRLAKYEEISKNYG